MTMWLKQSTAATIKMGPFVDNADGNTVEPSLTISQADIRLSKNGGDMAQTNNSAGATYDETGYYDVPLDTTDTNTLGRLKVMIHESGALPVWQDFMIVPAQVWDSFFGADKLQVHVDEMTAGIITASVIATDAIDADAIADNAINAAAIAADAITAAKLHADVTTELQSGLATAASITTLQTSVDDIPTNAELATSQAAADDATLAAIAALNNLSAAQVNAEVDTALADVGLTTTITGRVDAAISTRASQASVDDVPTNAELATALAAADDAVLAAVATRASQTSVDTVDDLLDTELPALTTAVADLPTNAELATALGAADDATLAAIAALSIPDANTIADAVLSRGVSNVEDTADTTSLAALLLAAFESSVSGTTWTIRKTTGSSFVVKTVTVDADADPITGIT